MKYSLKKFVEICNNCNGKILDKTGKKIAKHKNLHKILLICVKQRRRIKNTR